MSNAYDFPVTGLLKIRETGTIIPLLDIPVMSDGEWRKRALKSRAEHPEYYSGKESENDGHT